MTSIDPNYYESQFIEAYPTSNSVDNGKLNLEENMTIFTTKMTRRSWCFRKEDFVPVLNKDTNQVTVSTGVCNIIGYTIATSSEIIIDPPTDLQPEDDEGLLTLMLAIKLAYDSSDHVLGDVGIEGYTKYCNGVYIAWITEDYLTEDTLILAYATWDGSNFTNMYENPDKLMVFDTDKILVFPGVTLKDYIDSIPRRFIHRYGDLAHEIDSTGEDVYKNNEGGDVYGNLKFRTSREDIGDNVYGIRIGIDSKQMSELQVKPLDKTSSIYDAILGSNHLRSYVRLGSSMMSYNVTDDNYVIEGVPIYLKEDTTVEDSVFHVLTHNGTKYHFLENVFESTYGTNNIYQGHDNNNSYINFTKTDKSQNARINYDYVNKVLYIDGKGGSSIRFDLDALIQNITFKNNTQISFLTNESDNTNYINKNQFRFGTKANYIEYNENYLSMVSPNYYKPFKTSNTTYNTYTEIRNTGHVILNGSSSYSGAPGILFTSAETSANDVLLYKSPGSNILQLSGNFTATGDIRANRVFNAVYNDGVEFFKKSDPNEIILPGDIICVDENGLAKKVNNDADRNTIIGVCSSEETYGYALGGDNLSDEEKVPVGLFGRLYVNTHDDSIKAGDLIMCNENGYAEKFNNNMNCFKYIIGMAMNSPKNDKVYIKIK